MKDLNIHSEGKSEFIKSLKEKYDKLMLELNNKPDLTQSEKNKQQKALNASYKRELKNTDYSNYLKK